MREGYTIADDGSTGSSVIDSAHGLVTFRPSSVLRWKKTHEVTNKSSTSVYEDPSNTTLTHIPSVTTLSPTLRAFATNAAPIVLIRQKQMNTSRLATSYQIIDISGRNGGFTCASGLCDTWLEIADTQASAHLTQKCLYWEQTISEDLLVMALMTITDYFFRFLCKRMLTFW